MKGIASKASGGSRLQFDDFSKRYYEGNMFKSVRWLKQRIWWFLQRSYEDLMLKKQHMIKVLKDFHMYFIKKHTYYCLFLKMLIVCNWKSNIWLRCFKIFINVKWKRKIWFRFVKFCIVFAWTCNIVFWLFLDCHSCLLTKQHVILVCVKMFICFFLLKQQHII